MALTIVPASSTGDPIPLAMTKLYIGPEYDGSLDLTDGTFTEVGGLMNIPQLGPSGTAVTLETISEGLKLTTVGTTDPGGGEFTFYRMFSDAGQVAMEAARANTGKNYVFFIEYPDKASSGGHGTRKVFAGIVLSVPDSGGGPNDPLKVTANIKANTLPNIIAAT